MFFETCDEIGAPDNNDEELSVREHWPQPLGSCQLVPNTSTLRLAVARLAVVRLAVARLAVARLAVATVIPEQPVARRVQSSKKNPEKMEGGGYLRETPSSGCHFLTDVALGTIDNIELLLWTEFRCLMIENE